jgi:hypothetical protein
MRTEQSKAGKEFMMHGTKDKETPQQKDVAAQAGEARELLDRSTRDEEPETEASQDLALMRENLAFHLTAAICKHLLCTPEDALNTSVVLPHLCRCSWCRGTLYETLTLCATDAAHPGYTLLATAEEWARWEAAGQQATQVARQSLREQGVNIVYARDGMIYEEHPDGMEVPVAEVTAETPVR